MTTSHPAPGVPAPPARPPQQPNQPDPQAVGKAIAQVGAHLLDAFRRRPANGQNNTVSPWLIGLIPVVFACLHLMIVSRGDAQTLRSLVQNLNVTALVLATVLPLGTTILVWAFLISLGLTMIKPKGQRKARAQTTILLFTLATFIGFFAMPLLAAVVNLAILATLLSFAAVSRWANKKEGWQPAKKFFAFSAFAWATALILVPLLIWLGFLGVWMPQERITLGATQVIEPAYVLSYDDHWTKYMDGSHKMHIVPTRDITCREVVDAPPTSRWGKTPYALWQGRHASSNSVRPTAPSCVIPAPAPRPGSATPAPAATPSNSPPKR
jgi:hypothetical protein